MKRYLFLFLCITMSIIVKGQPYYGGDYGENFSWDIEYEGCTLEYVLESPGGNVDKGGSKIDYFWSYYEQYPLLGISVKPNINKEFKEAYLEWEDSEGNVYKDDLEFLYVNYVELKHWDYGSIRVGGYDFYKTNWITNDKSVLNIDYEGEGMWEYWIDEMPCIKLHANCRNTVKIFFEKGDGESFSWSVESNVSDKHVFGPDSNWLYDTSDLDDNGELLVGPFFGLYVNAGSDKYLFSEAYLEWEDEDGNVGKDVLTVRGNGLISEEGDSPKNQIGDENARWIGNREGRIQTEDGIFNIPCIALHKNSKNTVKVVFNESTIIHFSLNNEYNGHPLYDDCFFWDEGPLYVSVIRSSWDEYIGASVDETIESIEIPGSYSEFFDWDSSGTIHFENEYDPRPLAFSPEYINGPGEYDVVVSPSLFKESSPYKELIPYFFWGYNFQFDLDGNGEVKYTCLGSEETATGEGLVGKNHHGDMDEGAEKLLIKLYPNSGKTLESVKVIFEEGLDNTLVETTLKTMYNEELGCYEIIPDDGYSLDKDNYLTLEGGWMNTIVVRFKDVSVEPTVIDFTLTKPTEVNGHPLYDDCMMLFDKMDVAVNVCRTVSDGDANNPQYYDEIEETYTAEVPGTFSQQIDLTNRFITLDCESGLGDYSVYGFKPVASWEGTIEGAGNEVAISYDIPLANKDGDSNLPWIWGNNLQIDLDDNGSVQIGDNEEPLSGPGTVYTLHEPNPDTPMPTIRLFANPGKKLGTAYLVYESGLDDKTVETALNTTYNDGLGCYELTAGEGYNMEEGRLVLNGGWMNTIVVRFKDADILELADDDSDKVSGERNSDLISDKSGIMTDVKLSDRTFYKDGYWNTLCLPFSLTESEIAAGPLAGADIRSLNWASVEKIYGHFPDYWWHVSLKFKKESTIEAGKPYIIKWESGDNITDPIFENVTVYETQNPVTLADGHVVFTGYYDAFTATPNDDPMIYYLTDKNKLKYTSKDRLLKACRAYFTFTPLDDSGVGDGFIFDLDFGNGETGITTTLSPESEGSNRWYTLDGRILSGKPAVKGVYINNGRKVVIK